MPLIVTENLTKRYPGPGGGVLALDELSVEIEPGIVGLVGANGAGKSTLLRILLGLLAPTSGRASVMGLDTAAHGRRIRERVGYMPEHDVLPPDLTATDLVAHLAEMSGLPRIAARERTADVLRHVGLFEERYRQIGGYSTGMRQRVKLAQALVHDPRLLLLDEPTNGLDPAGRDEMLDLVHRTGTEFGIAVLVCSHLLGEIERVCDHVVAIDGDPDRGGRRGGCRPRGRSPGGRVPGSPGRAAPRAGRGPGRAALRHDPGRGRHPWPRADSRGTGPAPGRGPLP
jgi:ABC-2 type transport system ATP-binding protein